MVERSAGSPKDLFSPELRATARQGRRRLLYAQSGNRIGESHHKAVLTDHEVDLLLELRAEGKTHAWLAEKFEIPKISVRSICSGRTRSVAIARVVTQREEIEVNPEMVAQAKGFAEGGTVVGTKDLRRHTGQRAMQERLSPLSGGAPLVSLREMAEEYGITASQLRGYTAFVPMPAFETKHHSSLASNTYYRREALEAWIARLKEVCLNFPSRERV